MDLTSKRHHIHFVGIGGIGMSGIAEVLLTLGFPVSGSDLAASDSTERLGRLGAAIALGHHADRVGPSVDVVVISSAVKFSNPEVVRARELIALTWNAPNQIAAMTFSLLYVLRLSTKINIFIGVPNTKTDILPPHLVYLKSYYGPNRLRPALVLTTVASLVLAVWIGSAALAAAAGSPEAVGASLLFALAALGVLEHLFLALPFRDGALWGWALPR